MTDSLITGWNDLQARPVLWGETKKEIEKLSAEIKILDALRQCGEDFAPNGLPLAEMIDSRRDILQQIERESHGG